MQRPGRARVLRPRVELEGDAPRLDVDHRACRSASPTAAPAPRRRRSAASSVERHGMQHRADHLAVAHRVERLSPPVERRGARDHAGEVELPVERPLREAREVLLRQVVAAVRDEDARPLREERRQVELGLLAGRARGRSGRTCRRSRAGRAPARTVERRPTTSKTKSTGPGSRVGRAEARRLRRACARRGRSRGSRTRPRCARPGSPTARPRRSRSPRRARPPTPSPSRAPT